jgi:S-adenosylmethionine:tRNA ribosyltransferase-isomerase
VHLSDFDYDLPPGRIAQEPLPERDASRLLVLERATGRVTHGAFRDLPSWLRAGDLLVVNDTRVLPSRLLGRREGFVGEVEALLLNPVREASGRFLWKALVRPARKLPAGTVLRLGASGVRVSVREALDERTRLLEFPKDVALLSFLEAEGHVPLPPYIDRPDDAVDRERYQTIFAEKAGAVAAPTASLHFTPRVVEALERAGVGLCRVTLHVGVGTFTAVTAPDPRDHVMEAEYFRVPPESASLIEGTRVAGGRVVAVGTTVVRTLETAGVHDPARDLWTVEPGDGWTDKFIYAPYTFRIVDALLTNFHLPRSTLLMLVSAFAGLDRTRRAYHEAIREGYRFYSYGDAMLIV